jgi:hypothetical protein
MKHKIQINTHNLKKALEFFYEYSKEEKFKEDMKERSEKEKFFQNTIKKKLSELSFSRMIKKLWASQMWGNKDYLVEKIIKLNKGIKRISLEFNKLVSKKKTPGEKYEEFLKNIKGMGPAMVTEILCHLDPDNAGIWNDRARKSLAWLEVRGIPYDKYRITGKEYDEFNQKMKRLANILKQEGYKNVDLLFVDYFLSKTYEMILNKKLIVKEKRNVSKHDEIIDKLTQIGSWLGFETEQEKQIATGARVDVIWRARIGNLGAVSYVFEVQERGSIDSLIMYLQRAQNNPTVQKLIVVSDKQQIERIKEEIKTLSETFRKVVNFWEIEDVENTYQNLQQVTESITRLHLLEE